MEEKKKSKLWILIICLLIVILGIGGYVCYDKFFNNKSSNKVDENTNEKDYYKEKEESKVDSKYSGMYVIHDETRIYTADVEEFLVSGKKTEVIYDAYDNQTIKVFNNKIFYF